jgi:hypothetical protein
MSASDASRADLFVLLEQAVGRETATALMDHIPPTGWPEFATKSDVALLRSDVERVEHRILGEVDRRLRAQTWITTTTLLAGLGLAFTAGRIG